jgi:hypothetical protein
MFGPKLKVFRPRCEEDGQCHTFGRQLILALVQGAAPLLVGYAIAKLDPSAVDDGSFEVAMEDDDGE